MIPHELTDNLRSLRIKHALVMKAILDVLETIVYFPLITTDESWLLFRYQPSGCYTPAGIESPTKIRVGENDRKQMYVPLIASNGIIFDWFVPTNASIDSTLWINNRVKAADECWQNQWGALTDERKTVVKQCIAEAVQAARRVIIERSIPLVSPLAGITELHPSEELFLSFRVTSKRTSSMSTGVIISSSRPSSFSSSSSSTPSISHSENDSEEETTTDTPLDEFHHAEIISRPERPSAAQSQEDLKRFPQTYLTESSADDKEFTLSPAVPKRQSRKKIDTHIHSSQTTTTDIPRCFFHFNNAPAHNSFSSRAALHNTHELRFPQPPYSPDLAICDFSYFGQLKTALAHSQINATNLAELKAAIAGFNEKLKPTMISLFKAWQKRLEYISSHNGDYYPSSMANCQPPSTKPLPSQSDSSILLRLEETRGIVGLENEDSHFCYLNAVIQSLLATVPLVSYFFCKAETYQSLLTSHTTPLCLRLFELVQQAWSLDPIKRPAPYTTLTLPTLQHPTPIPVLPMRFVCEQVESILPDRENPQQDASETFEFMWSKLV